MVRPGGAGEVETRSVSGRSKLGLGRLWARHARSLALEQNFGRQRPIWPSSARSTSGP